MAAERPPAPVTSRSSIIFLLKADFLTSPLRIKDNTQLNKKLLPSQISGLEFDFSLSCLFYSREGINQDLLHLPPCVTEQFIELLCQYSPDQVLETLKVLECCRLEETIQVGKRCMMTGAMGCIQISSYPFKLL